MLCCIMSPCGPLSEEAPFQGRTACAGAPGTTPNRSHPANRVTWGARPSTCSPLTVVTWCSGPLRNPPNRAHRPNHVTRRTPVSGHRLTPGKPPEHRVPGIAAAWPSPGMRVSDRTDKPPHPETRRTGQPRRTGQTRRTPGSGRRLTPGNPAEHRVPGIPATWQTPGMRVSDRTDKPPHPEIRGPGGFHHTGKNL